MTNNETKPSVLQYIIVGIAAGAFGVSVIVKLFLPTSDVGDVSTVFIIVSGLVFGSNLTNFFSKKL